MSVEEQGSDETPEPIYRREYVSVFFRLPLIQGLQIDINQVLLDGDLRM